MKWSCNCCVVLTEKNFVQFACNHSNNLLYNICIYCHLLKYSMKQTKHIYLSSNKLLRPLSYRVLKGQNNLSYCKFCFKIKFYTMVMNIEQKIVLQILFDSTSIIFQIEKFMFDYVTCTLFSS